MIIDYSLGSCFFAIMDEDEKRFADADAESASGSDLEINEELGDRIEDWDEDLEGQSTKSLFCEKMLDSAAQAVDFDEKNFGFDLKAVKGLYNRIKMINFVRKCVRDGKCPFNPSESLDTAKLKKSYCGMLPDESLWKSGDEFLQPVLEDDPLLSWGCDEDDAEFDEAQDQDEDFVKEKLQEAQKEFEGLNLEELRK